MPRDSLVLVSLEDYITPLYFQMTFVCVMHDRDFVVRAACSRDYTFVEMLVRKIQLKDQILRDLVQFNKARRDSVSRNLFRHLLTFFLPSLTISIF